MITIDDFATVKFVLEKLKPISKMINQLDCKSCNGEISEEKYNHDLTKLMLQANGIANHVMLSVFHQSDPRGCSLYLIDDTMDDSTYNRGIAIY